MHRRAVERGAHLAREERKASRDRLVVLRVRDPHALVAVIPRLVEPREEVMTGEHEHAFRLEPTIELGARNRQPGQPQPEEERAFELVDPERNAGKLALEDLARAAGLVAVERHDRAPAEREDLAALDPRLGEHRPDAADREI